MPFNKSHRAAWLAAVLILILAAGGPLAAAQEAAPQTQRGPSSVDLEYFTGTAYYPNHILLEWYAVSEQFTAAYRLKRGVTPDPLQAVIITNPPIPANAGSTAPQYHDYEDSAGLVPGTIYYYWIEDQDLQSGQWLTHEDDPALNPIVPWGCSRYDVVCNFVIDSQDIAALAGRWNCALGNPCYDAHFDVNSDNVINVRDILLTASRWGCQLGQGCYP